MLDLNLRSKNVQRLIDKYTDALMPVFRRLVKQIDNDPDHKPNVQIDNFSLDTANSFSRENPDLVALYLIANCTDNMTYYAELVIADLSDINTKIQVMDIKNGVMKSKDNSAVSIYDYDDGQFDLEDMNEYNSDHASDYDRKLALYEILDNFVSPNKELVYPYTDEVLARFTLWINHGEFDVRSQNVKNGFILPVVEMMNKDGERSWHRLPEDVNGFEEKQLQHSLVVFSHSLFNLRPDDKFDELNKFAQIVQDNHLESALDVLNYVEKQSIDALPFAFYKYSDDKFNEVLGGKKPANIIKEISFYNSPFPVTNPFEDYAIAYFMLGKDGVKLFNKKRAIKFANDNKSLIFNAFCKMNDLHFNSDRTMQPYWI